MAAFNYISFGDFEVPPLDLPAFSVPTRTQNPDWDTGSECSDTASGKDADEETDTALPQQGAASSNDWSDLTGERKPSNSHTEQHGSPRQKFGEQKHLLGPSEHQTIPEGIATLKPSSVPVEIQ
jgi:hypothetical protein